MPSSSIRTLSSHNGSSTRTGTAAQPSAQDADNDDFELDLIRESDIADLGRFSDSDEEEVLQDTIPETIMQWMIYLKMMTSSAHTSCWDHELAAGPLLVDVLVDSQHDADMMVVVMVEVVEEVTVPVVMMVAADEDPVVGLSLFLEMKKVNNLCTNY